MMPLDFLARPIINTLAVFYTAYLFLNMFDLLFTYFLIFIFHQFNWSVELTLHLYTKNPRLIDYMQYRIKTSRGQY